MHASRISLRMHGCDAEFAFNGCLLKLKNLFQWPCDMVRREAACARVIPDSGSSPSRDPEHFSGSRLGILPLQEPPTQDPEALDPDSGWIPTRVQYVYDDYSGTRKPALTPSQDPVPDSGSSCTVLKLQVCRQPEPWPSQLNLTACGPSHTPAR